MHYALAGVCMCIRESNTLPFSPRCCCSCWSVRVSVMPPRLNGILHPQFITCGNATANGNHYISFNTTNKKQQRKTNTASRQPPHSLLFVMAKRPCVRVIQTKKIKEKLKAFFVLDRMHKYNTTTYVCEMICAFSQSLRVFHYHFLFFLFLFLSFIYMYTLHVTCDRE